MAGTMAARSAEQKAVRMGAMMVERKDLPWAGKTAGQKAC
jgi:hypothetical protein